MNKREYNGYLEVYFEDGMIGIVLFAAFLLAYHRKALRGLNHAYMIRYTLHFLRNIVIIRMRLIKNIYPYRPNEISAEAWDRDYANGVWDHIRQIDELGHYSLIAGYVHCAKKGKKLLDVGCGEGIRLERLCESKYSGYTGIDISEVAIARATEQRNGKTTFVVASIEGFETNERYDVIIFNECLYYLHNPLAMLEKYERFLEENGAFIISMYVSDNSVKLRNMIERRYAISDTAKVTNKVGGEWIVQFIIP